MLSRGIFRCTAGLLLAATIAIPSTAFALTTFGSEREAQVHCPKDTVIWLNLPTMIWHYKGQRWYANTKHGAYACEREAGASGARGTHNGQ
jgi:hypothetical protein